MMLDAWSEGQLGDDDDHMSASSNSEVAQLEDIEDKNIQFIPGL